MKKRFYIFVLLLFLGFNAAFSQHDVYIQGLVTDQNTGYPVFDYPVFILTDDSIYFNLVYTSPDGFFADTVPFVFSGGINVFTYDCNGYEHYSYIEDPHPDSTYFIHFDFCIDTCDIFADFTYSIDTNNPNLVHFTDLSMGEGISQWYWDFGDGYFSSEQNPSHLYQEEGLYFVLLTVSDSSGNCFDYYSEEVFIEDTVWNCNADFSVELDSINKIPYVYYFTDKSEGNITSWEWDFGDGAFSYEQSPVHIYSAPGIYEVCLTVISENGNNYCEDTRCMYINTPSYYNFGGQVFAGGYPINVDENDSSNKATAYLYRHYKGLWRLVDKREFWRFGYYWFTNELEGDYIIKVELLEGSPLFNEFAPGYFDDKILWQNSTLFSLQNPEVFDVNIKLKQLSLLQLGTGSVTGVVYNDDNCNIFCNNHIPVYLFSGDQLSMVKYTDENGFFYFGDLPYGNYRLTAEITGMYSDKLDFTIDAQHQDVKDVELRTSCSNPDFIIPHNTTPFALNIEKIFPLPANQSLTVEIFSKNNRRVILSLYDITGKVIKSFEKNLYAGKNLLTFSTAEIPGGLYMMKIGEAGNNGFAAEKIIVKH